MELKLMNKRALVCGASKGIGQAIARELAELGAQVTVLARSEDKLKEVVAALPGAGHDFVAVDSSNRKELGAAVATKGPFDILINNSGGPPGGPVSEASEDQFQKALESHLFAGRELVELLLPGMKEKKFGRIINIISTSVKAPLAGLGVSNTVRAAVASWGKTLANEVGQFGITVNSVLPGATSTDRLSSILDNKAAKSGQSIEEVSQQMQSAIPAKRFGKPEEVAAVAAFLATPAAAYVNGVAIAVDGGRTPCL